MIAASLKAQLKHYTLTRISPEDMRGLIDRWMNSRPRPACNGDPLSETAVWKIVTGYAEQCGLKWIKPHYFRRFVGTQLAAKDIRKAQVALEHKSIEITVRHYVLDELEVGLTDHLY